MEKINRMLINICSDNLQESKAFYTSLFDFDVDYDTEWFIHLMSRDKQLELGIIDRNHAIVPEEVQGKPDGAYITIVVENVDELFRTAKADNLTIVKAPEDTFYGQRRMLLKDPDGTMLDVSSPIPDFKF